MLSVGVIKQSFNQSNQFSMKYEFDMFFISERHPNMQRNRKRTVEFDTKTSEETSQNLLETDTERQKD